MRFAKAVRLARQKSTPTKQSRTIFQSENQKYNKKTKKSRIRDWVSITFPGNSGRQGVVHVAIFFAGMSLVWSEES